MITPEVAYSEATQGMGDEPPTFADHISVDDLERYHSGTLRGEEFMVAADHLLLCQYCEDRLLAVTRFVTQFKAGKIRNHGV